MDKRDESAKSIFTLNSNKTKNKDSIPCRIEFIQDLLKGHELQSLISIVNNSESNEKDCESYDTRKELGKKNLDFSTVITNIGGQLDYIKSGTTGHTFHGICGDPNKPTYDYAVKVSAFPKKSKYGGIYDIRRPENAEINMIKILSKLIINKQTPHIVLPIGTFDTKIDNFVNLIDDKVVENDNKKYIEFVKKYKKGEYYDNVSVLISEWANRGDFLDYIRKYYKEFSPIHWKVFFFQIISSLAVIQSQYPSFRHNDLKGNNILIHRINKENSYFNYRVVRTNYKIPNIGYQLKLWDFDFACIPGVVDNQKVKMGWTKAINVTPDKNRYYDLHYFFNTLIKKGFFPQFMSDDHIPQDAKNFVKRIVPEKYQKGKFVHERGRILINHEHVIPDDILKYDEYFAEFRKNQKISKKIKSKSKKRSKSLKIKNTSISQLLNDTNDNTYNVELKLKTLINNKKHKNKYRKKNNKDVQYDKIKNLDIDNILLE